MAKMTAADKYAPEVVSTGDGSHTLFIPALGEHYHSFHSSVREAVHVYINAGLLHIAEKTADAPIEIFEVGFGTGLNALVTALSARKAARDVRFTSIEFYPLSAEDCSVLNYCDHLDEPRATGIFEQLHAAKWEEDVEIHGQFSLHKIHDDFFACEFPEGTFHLIYFDAFGFRAQEEFWSTAVFEKCFKMLKPGGALVTYASKGLVRRNMQAAGFTVEKLEGPPGKREMVRAVKPN